jgi:putative colanic acid biosynthesis UDP-glucose lipid carrier transferase
MPSGGLIRHYSPAFGLFHRVLDAVLIMAMLYVAAWAYAVPVDDQIHLAGAWAIVLFLLFAESRGLYASWRTLHLRDEAVWVTLTWSAVAFTLVFFSFLAKTTGEFSRVAMVGWAVLVPLALMAERTLLRSMLHLMREQGLNTRTYAIVGAGDSAQKLVEAINGEKWMGMKLVGIFDDRSPERLAQERASDTAVRGKLQDLVEECKAGKIDYVYIALSMKAEKRIVALVNQLADTTASVYFVPDLFISDLMNSRWMSVGGVPVVSVFESPFYGVDGWLKRFEDLVIGSLIVAVCAIPMLLIAIGVKLTSPGPVLFKQRRYGLNSKVVEVWKFRTMSVQENGDRVDQATRNDPRVTPYGAFLRKTSLDELPQFFNVLSGGMSIVGPRPHAVAHNEQYRRLIHGYMLRHKVKPGITGWAQINGWRGETDTLEKMRRRLDYDLEYVRNWSLWLDIRIIGLTIVRGFVGKNVY